MKKLLGIQATNNELHLWFEDMAAADTFITAQSNNPAWRAQFTFRHAQWKGENAVEVVGPSGITLHCD